MKENAQEKIVIRSEMEEKLSTQGETVSSEQNVETPIIVGNDYSINGGFPDSPKYILIGVGQGGTSVAMKVKEKMGSYAKVIAVNTSHQDLSVLPESMVDEECKFKFGSLNGTGKNRDFSKDMFKTHAVEDPQTGIKYDFVRHFCYNYRELLFGTNETEIYVFFTSAGGTGSGSGPIFTTKLTQYVQQVERVNVRGEDIVINDYHRPIVCGVCINPSVYSDDEKVKSLRNAIACGKEIESVIKKKLASFFIVDNTIEDKEKVNSKIDAFELVNERIATAFLLFSNLYGGQSKYKCIDSQDKRSALMTPGYHSLLTFNKNSEPVGFQFLIPKNQRVRQLVAQLPEDYVTQNENGIGSRADKIMNDILNKLDIKVDDKNVGFISLDSKAVESMMLNGMSASIIQQNKLTMPIIGLFGCTELGSLFEPLETKLQLILKTQEEKQNIMDSSATVFENVTEINGKVNEIYDRNVVDVEQIDDMF